VIYLNEPPWEPPHVHVYQGQDEVKIWLGQENNPPSLGRAYGMAPHDQQDALEAVRSNMPLLRRAWNDRH
jgi:Domain of unknown function (DUF4160)